VDEFFSVGEQSAEHLDPLHPQIAQIPGPFHLLGINALGTTRGDCGALTTAPRRVFPFAAQTGRWVLVLDTHRGYRAHASGPRAKIVLHVRPFSL